MCGSVYWCTVMYSVFPCCWPFGLLPVFIFLSNVLTNILINAAPLSFPLNYFFRIRFQEAGFPESTGMKIIFRKV